MYCPIDLYILTLWFVAIVHDAFCDCLFVVYFAARMC
jgi:hypothetical protein